MLQSADGSSFCSSIYYLGLEELEALGQTGANLKCPFVPLEVSCRLPAS